ncbi:PREDICTED: transcription termination factor MTERF5, chloroplastic-like [Tarenaya hassleriana]|uniref:transcription termination factor MTERF5, chloroplastic-like n=2 Tax=Tarenaya hassleriana TaxID=28532 RepID=UPI00053C493D|nr:PREDICTED: transcription termination factor MTERF5, chloroplastic-like [Tarenaya hassleriana]
MQFLSSLASHVGNLCLRWKQFPYSHHFSSSPNSHSRGQLIDFLKKQGFPKSQAVSMVGRFPHVGSLDRPRTVVQLFRNLGFSDSQIRSSIRVLPQIIFCDATKNLEPKIRFLEELGFSGSALPKFLSKNSSVMSLSLKKRLIPSTEIIKTILSPNDENNKELVKVLSRCSWLLNRDPNAYLLPNIAYLKSCGIVGSQLAFLLKKQPRLLISEENKLRVYVSRALDLGFSVNSGMLAHAVHALSCLSEKTFDRKMKTFLDHGFSEDQTREMIRRAPGLVRCSTDKLKLGMEFYMETMGIKRETLVKRPCMLMHSMEERVIPRVKVLQVLRGKGLLKKKEPSVLEMLQLSEKDFLEKFISRFGDEHTMDLLVAYKGHLVDASDTSSGSCSSSDD